MVNLKTIVLLLLKLMIQGLCIHPTFKNYGYNVDENKIYFIPKNRTLEQRTNKGYCYITVGEHKVQKSFSAHRFIWECCNDIIPYGYEIDHINRIKTDNRISNLRCVTIEENRKNRDHSNIIRIASTAHQLQRFIKAININTQDFNCFKNKSQCAKYYGISPALVYLISEHKNMAKTANTIKGNYKFEYVDEKDVKNLVDIPHGNIKTYY